MGRGIRLTDIKKLRCRFAPGCAPHRACRERIPRTVRYHAPIRSLKSVPDTVSRSREFQVRLHPRPRVETVRKRPKSNVVVTTTSTVDREQIFRCMTRPQGSQLELFN